MRSRGQSRFTRLTPFGARNYERLMSGPAAGSHYGPFAKDLVQRVTKGKVLDIGTGPGRSLAELHSLAPGLELHGIDISPAMLALARENLKGIPVELRLGAADATGHEAAFFDAVTCTKSFYLWDGPERCLAEIHRILKPGGVACLYESIRDYDRAATESVLKQGMALEPFLVRLMGPGILRKQLRSTYTRDEIRDIASRSPFGACEIEDARTKLPVWVSIILRKT